jgi:ABC-type nitrate/sulfonate/bicarbonate transport system ATPase subunit
VETSRSEALAVSHLAKGFGRLPVLKDISFGVWRGELVCVLGPSGCGKTTLLRCIAGLTPWDSGTVEVNGQVLRQRELSDQGLGVIFQEPRLLPWRTAAENVRLPFELKDALNEATERSVQRALALVGLADFDGSYPHQLSGGMKSRLALARALAMSPRTLLLDEPLTGLDVRTREELQDEIARIQAGASMSLLWVTHDPEEAVYLADRIIVLSPRPAVVRGVVEVPTARPRGRHSDSQRDLALEIRRLFA